MFKRIKNNAIIALIVLFLSIFTAQKTESDVLVGLEWRFKLHSTTPIKNSTSLNDSANHFYLDANDIAELISVGTKELVTFNTAVSDWSEEIFIPADCYIPLCRSDPIELSWVLTETEFLPQRVLQEIENFEPSGVMEFEGCCALADTKLSEDDEEDDEECIVNPLQSCRTQVYEAPCGETIEASSSNRNLQDEAICIENEATMEISARFFDLENTEICCVQCGCFGDPRCVSFSGESDIWVLCDGRGPVDPTDPDSRCQIEEEVCIEQLDHENNICQWIALTETEEQDWTILQNGSRCQPNSESSESRIVMYEFDEFALTIRQIDRGIIDEVELRLEDEVFTLQADDCISEDFNKSWAKDGSFVVPTESFVQIIQTIDGFEEIVWAISQTETAMHVRLRCLRQRDDDGNESPPRIHVEALVEPEADFGGRNNLQGFCVSNQFDNIGSTENTELIESGEGCTASDLAKSEEVSIARALCGETVLYGNIATCLVSFCEENYFPSFLDAMQCVISFGDGVEGFNFRETFCKARTFTESDSLDCEEKWTAFGALEAINIYYLNVNQPDLEEDCAESIVDLPDSLGECEAGVELQYLNQALEWVTFLGLPESRPPCGVLELNNEDHSEVFDNPIRWKQCTISSACLTATNTLCRAQTRFASTILLKPENLETDQPTKAPTFSPTNGPTVFESPTGTPTFSPTKNPTTPGNIENVPTESPTKGPSEKPTVSPTEFPTSFQETPTGRPTERPTETPTVSPTDFPTAFGNGGNPTDFPTALASNTPTMHDHMDWGTGHPAFAPSDSPTNYPTTVPTPYPTFSPTLFPTKNPTLFPSSSPTPFPSISPTNSPTTGTPTESPTESPSLNPTTKPSTSPTLEPSETPSLVPTVSPTSFPTRAPTEGPTKFPSVSPTSFPTVSPTNFPTRPPTGNPTKSPTGSPSESPTQKPTNSPSFSPTESPTLSPTPYPTRSPTPYPTESPTISPTLFPTNYPTWSPSEFPTEFPSNFPTISPIPKPTESPTERPTSYPTDFPTTFPTDGPTETPTLNPTLNPTIVPTSFPTRKLKWGDGAMFLNYDRRGTRVLGRSGIVQEKIPSTKKLDLNEAGEVVFYAMYNSEEAAERELFATNPEELLALINKAFATNNQDVLAVTADLSLLVTSVENSPESDDEATESTNDKEGWDFFDLGSNFRSISLLAGLLFVAVLLAIIFFNVSPLGTAVSSTELASRLDL